jgi:uncharacterized delta-60 repeat protein
VVGVAGSAQATPSTLSSSLGPRGEVTTTFGLKTDDVAQALAVQPDGRIVVAGYSLGGSGGDGDFRFAVARYRADGTLDPKFGTGGKVTTDFGAGSTAAAVALQQDGKIVVAGDTFTRPDADFALARYNANGTLDPSFGSGGKTTIPSSTADFVDAVALQPDGRIVVAGSSGSPQQRDDAFALARFNADGTLDPSFGSDGKVTTRFGESSDDFAWAVALQPDSKIVAVGSDFVYSREAPADFAVARYTSSGALDPTFGSGGKVTTNFGNTSDFANAAVLQPDGKIVAAGYTFLGRTGPSAFALTRYTPDGELDPTFGSGGRVTTDLGADSSVWAVALQPDGKILAAGTGHGGFALARYDTDGSLDTSFGSGGTVETAVGLGQSALAHGLGLGPGGKVVAAGSTITCTYGDFVLARYTVEGSLDTSFGSNGKRCLVPKVKGMKLDAARRSIKGRDCVFGGFSRAFSRTVPKGRVIGQFPAAGRACDPRIKVVVSVSKGKRR